MYTSSDERTGNFTFQAEGSTNPKSPFFIGKLSHPSPESGVIIGAGYDMSGRTPEQVMSDLSAAGLTATLAEKLSKGAGKTQTDADNFIATNRTVEITDIAVLRSLFIKCYPDYVKRAQEDFAYHAIHFRAAMKSYGKQYAGAVFFEWEDLYPAMRVMAVDFTYQGFGKKKPGYGRPMHMCMANNFDWLIHYITSTPGLSKYEAGRHRAAYLREKKSSETRAYSNSGAK